PVPLNTYMDHCDVSLGLEKISSSAVSTSGIYPFFDSISTSEPLTYRFDGKTEIGRMSGAVVIKKIDFNRVDATPKKLKSNPVDVMVTVSGQHHGFSRVDLKETLIARSFGVNQSFELSLGGVDGLLFSENRPSWFHFLHTARGKGKAGLELSNIRPFSGFAKGIDLNGTIRLNGEISLEPDASVELKGRIQSHGLDAAIGDFLSIRNLKTDFDFSKIFLIDPDPSRSIPELPLSVKVMKENSARHHQDNSPPDLLASLSGQWQKRLNNDHSFSFDSARIGSPLRFFEMHQGIIDLEIENGLPKLTHLETNLLGGSLMGSGSIFEKENKIYLTWNASFSGLNPRNLLYQKSKKPQNEEMTLSGRISAAFPLSIRLQQVFQELGFNLQFSHIGSEAMQEILSILDPYETNETMVSIRRMLRSGKPKWIEVDVKNGILALNGEITVKGIPVRLPSVERLNLSEVSGLNGYEKTLISIQPVIEILQSASRRTLTPDR
ncbi:MAG: hypothetical protein AB1659_08725, partial [Thermodesulfobacteriota bacterium]